VRQRHAVKELLFQSTHPVRGATTYSPPSRSTRDFNPRTPCGVRPVSPGDVGGANLDFNPRTPCGVRHRLFKRHRLSPPISIHAPRAGCDHPLRRPRASHSHFNPRTPCGVRLFPLTEFAPLWEFQSTHPVRGATAEICVCHDKVVISIHAPRAGCDDIQPFEQWVQCDFNPRTPCGVRQEVPEQATTLNDFNPRTPCGVRRTRLARRPARQNFNPRTPCGVRPVWEVQSMDVHEISIHAPRAGCDRARKKDEDDDQYFNPRTPCGVRLGTYRMFGVATIDFNPRTPCGVRPSHDVVQFNRD